MGSAVADELELARRLGMCPPDCPAGGGCGRLPGSRPLRSDGVLQQVPAAASRITNWAKKLLEEVRGRESGEAPSLRVVVTDICHWLPGPLLDPGRDAWNVCGSGSVACHPEASGSTVAPLPVESVRAGQLAHPVDHAVVLNLDRRVWPGGVDGFSDAVKTGSHLAGAIQTPSGSVRRFEGYIGIRYRRHPRQLSGKDCPVAIDNPEWSDPGIGGHPPWTFLTGLGGAARERCGIKVAVFDAVLARAPNNAVDI